MPNDKAPGLDGLTGRFYKASWQIIKGDIMAAISVVWRRYFRNFRQLNSTFITLLPKKVEAQQLETIGPSTLFIVLPSLSLRSLRTSCPLTWISWLPRIKVLSLKGSSFKIISLWFNKQLNFCTPKNNCKYFSSWISSKHLTPSPGLSCLRSWSTWALAEFGEMIAGLLTTSSTQILLNGVHGDFMNHQRGLRQGDPLSPIIFIIVTDALNLLISKAAEAGLLQPLSSRSIQHRVSLYVDDVVLFLQSSESDIVLTLRILHLFGKSSRAQDQHSEK
jgi:hypothetical protein